MKVEELNKFGAKLEMPKEAVREQTKIIFRALSKGFGFWGMIGIFTETFTNQIKLKKKYPETRRKAAAISEIIEKELFVFSGLFLALAKRLGREDAYDFFKTEVMNKIAKISMAAIYEVKDMKKCDGDIFENYKKFNIALFERTTKDCTWMMEYFENTRDKLTLKIKTCANVELFTELGVPELGKFGCDHDLAGYKSIEDDVNCEFRRMYTIAKGDEYCMFEFYRKGTAPDNAHLNK